MYNILEVGTRPGVPIKQGVLISEVCLNRGSTACMIVRI